MKTLIAFVLISILGIGISNANSGDTIVVPMGSAVTIDGVITGSEWADASTINIASIAGTVYFKHTATHLLVAFVGSYSGSTGIYVDKLHNEGSTPQTDDIWIHGSAGPFEWFGNGTAWQTTTPTDWIYSSNSSNEYSIALTKLDISLDSTNVLGVLFSFLDWSTTSAEITWPDGGNANLTNPNSWATMIIESKAVNINHFEINQNETFKFYPNPANNKINIEGFQDSEFNLSILNINGQELLKQEIRNRKTQIDISKLPSGIYFIKLTNDETVEVRKIIKEQ